MGRKFRTPPYPEIRRARALEGGQRLLVDSIRNAPTNVRRAVLQEVADLSKSQFLTPYNAWGAVLDILDRHLPELAAESRQFVAELAAAECDGVA